MHCNQAAFFGAVPSEGRVIIPSVGPARLASRSYYMLVMTLGNRPYPNSSLKRGSYS